jgi:hypothetical protein
MSADFYNLTNAFPNLASLPLGLYIESGVASEFTNAFPALVSCAGEVEINATGIEAGYSSMFPSLTSVGDFTFVLSAPEIGATLPPFLDNLQQATSISIYATNLDARTGMPTFPDITQIDIFRFSNSTLAAAYGGQPWNGAFPALTIAGQIDVAIGGLTSLQNFMPVLTTASDLTMILMAASYTGIAGLTNITGSFASLTRLTNSINISSVDLADFDEFAGLTGDTPYMQVINNDFLTNVLTGLSGINGAGGIYIEMSNNPVLPSTAQVAALRSNYISEGFTGTFNRSNNGPG